MYASIGRKTQKICFKKMSLMNLVELNDSGQFRLEPLVIKILKKSGLAVAKVTIQKRSDRLRNHTIFEFNSS